MWDSVSFITGSLASVCCLIGTVKGPLPFCILAYHVFVKLHLNLSGVF